MEVVWLRLGESCCWKNRGEEGEDGGGGVERGMKIAKWIEGRQEKTSRRAFVVKDGIGLGLRDKMGILMAGRKGKRGISTWARETIWSDPPIDCGSIQDAIHLILDIPAKDELVKSMTCL